MESCLTLTLYATGEGVRDKELQKFFKKLQTVSDCSFVYEKIPKLFARVFDFSCHDGPLWRRTE
jgi:hypothetical protein